MWAFLWPNQTANHLVRQSLSQATKQFQTNQIIQRTEQNQLAHLFNSIRFHLQATRTLPHASTKRKKKHCSRNATQLLQSSLLVINHFSFILSEKRQKNYIFEHLFLYNFCIFYIRVLLLSYVVQFVALLKDLCFYFNSFRC